MIGNRFLSRKMVSFLGATLIAVALTAPIALDQAYANNHRDDPYASSINYNSVSYTDARDKTDYTSSWNQFQLGPTHKAEVFATGATKWNPTYVGSKAYYFEAGDKRYMSNYVKEKGYPRALLWFSKPYTSGTLVGKWSPDSV